MVSRSSSDSVLTSRVMIFLPYVHHLCHCMAVTRGGSLPGGKHYIRVFVFRVSVTRYRILTEEKYLFISRVYEGDDQLSLSDYWTAEVSISWVYSANEKLHWKYFFFIHRDKSFISFLAFRPISPLNNVSNKMLKIQWFLTFLTKF